MKYVSVVIAISQHKRFSEENNMDPGKLPKEIEGLTEIEEMLIAQVFTVMTVYRLKEGQKSYRGNVINFPQDISEFTIRLPRHPSALNVLLIRKQSANNPSEFRDFTVRRNRVVGALLWLKSNNQYYENINIDYKIVQSLPENGSIIDLLLKYTVTSQTKKFRSMAKPMRRQYLVHLFLQ